MLALAVLVMRALLSIHLSANSLPLFLARLVLRTVFASTAGLLLGMVRATMPQPGLLFMLLALLKATKHP